MEKISTEKYLTELNNWHKYKNKEKFLMNENNVF